MSTAVIGIISQMSDKHFYLALSSITLSKSKIKRKEPRVRHVLSVKHVSGNLEDAGSVLMTGTILEALLHRHISG